MQQYAPCASVAIWSAPSGDLVRAKTQIEQLRALGPQTAVVTMGASGALVLQETLTSCPAPVGDIVDTLGAGDAFIARLLVGLAQAEEIGGLLRAATAYATGNCSTFGAFGYPTSINPSHDPVPTPPADRITHEAHHA